MWSRWGCLGFLRRSVGLACDRGTSLMRTSLIVVVGSSGNIVCITFFSFFKSQRVLNRSESATGCRPFLADMRCPVVSNGAPGRGVEVVEAIVGMFPVIQFPRDTLHIVSSELVVSIHFFVGVVG